MHTSGSRHSPFRSLSGTTTNLLLVIRYNHLNQYNDPLSNCSLSDLKTSCQPGGSFCFPFSGTVIMLFGKNICALGTRAFRTTKLNVLKTKL